MTYRGTPNSDEASLGQLTGELGHQISRLVRDEIRLAQAEMKHKSKRFGSGAGLIGTAGVLAWFGFGCLVAAAVLAVNLALAGWLSALIIGSALLIAAGSVGMIGRSQMRGAVPPMPREAMESTKEDIEVLKGNHG